MVVRPSRRTTLASELQPAKAPSSMVAMPFGRTPLFSERQRKMAHADLRQAARDDHAAQRAAASELQSEVASRHVDGATIAPIGCHRARENDIRA